MKRFVIRWGTYGYVTKRSSNRKPYALTDQDSDVRVWLTYKAAAKFLTTRDEQWAANCKIIEVENA